MVSVGKFWGHLVSFLGGVVATIYAVILEFAWDNLGHFWGHFCGHFGHVWGPFWCRFAVILGTFGGLFGRVRGFQSVTIPQQDVGVAITRGGIGEKGGAMGLDFCEHLVSICRSKGVAHVHLQQNFVRLRIPCP